MKLGMACEEPARGRREESARGGERSQPGEERGARSESLKKSKRRGVGRCKGGSEKFRLNKSSSVFFLLLCSVGCGDWGGGQQGTVREA